MVAQAWQRSLTYRRRFDPTRRVAGAGQLLSILFGALAMFAAVATSCAADRPPNIVLFLADDLGYGDVECYNSESKIPTPHLNRLARQGRRFTDAHSPCTVCTPTRYSVITGQMAFRVPRGGSVFTGAGGPSLIAPGRLTLPELLRRAGYATAATGKWHIGLTFYDSAGQPIHKGGLEAVRRIDYSQPIAGGPLDVGFDQFFGTACCPGTDWLYAYIVGKQIPVPPTRQVDGDTLPKHPYANDCRRGMIAPDFDLQELDLTFLRQSQKFLEQHVRSAPDQPFFLYHCSHAAHLPSFAGRAYQGRTKAGPHGDFVHELDDVVGQLLATLDRLNLSDNTIVLFTSDNGPEVPTVYYMRHDYQHDGARPWRGVKRDNWEGGHRVPYIVRWPGKVPAGTTCDQLTSHTDVMATLAAVIGSTLPDDCAEDSFNVLPAWLGEDTEPIRPYMLQQGFGGARYLALRTQRWAYLAHRGSGGNRYEKHKLLKEYYLPDSAPNAPAQLYDLNSDPGERRNLFFEQPEVVERLAGLLNASLDSGRSAPHRGPAGRER